MSHPSAGETLIMTAGCCLARRWGKGCGPADKIHSGDVVWIPPGEKHWHGATAGTTAMTHIVIQEQTDGKKTADWMERSAISNIGQGHCQDNNKRYVQDLPRRHSFGDEGMKDQFWSLDICRHVSRK